MGEIVHKIIQQTHIVISVGIGKPDQVAAEHLIIGESNPEKQGDADTNSYYDANNKCWRQSVLPQLFTLGLIVLPFDWQQRDSM